MRRILYRIRTEHFGEGRQVSRSTVLARLRHSGQVVDVVAHVDPALDVMVIPRTIAEAIGALAAGDQSGRSIIGLTLLGRRRGEVRLHGVPVLVALDDESDVTLGVAPLVAALDGALTRSRNLQELVPFDPAPR